MFERKYIVLIDGKPVAENMDMETALILVKGLFEEYYNECGFEVTIKDTRDENQYHKDRSEEE